MDCRLRQICFYEAFEEEAEALRHYLGSDVEVMFTDRTIQESDHKDPPAPLISTRTQSVFPDAWAGTLDGILSPSTDLLRLIDEGHLSGVGLDAYDHESALAVALRTGQSSEDDQVVATLSLAQKDHVILTPHNAFNTMEAVARKSEQSVQQMHHFLETGEFLWPVV